MTLDKRDFVGRDHFYIREPLVNYERETAKYSTTTFNLLNIDNELIAGHNVEARTMSIMLIIGSDYWFKNIYTTDKL